MTAAESLTSANWDTHTVVYRTRTGGRWRDYCDALHRRLIASHLLMPPRRVLKTDLFDEAAGTGLIEALASGSNQRVIGLDISRGVLSDAMARNAQLVAPVADLRSLPFANDSLDTIVSNSSLDHFESVADLEVALAELSRVSAPGAQLLITLDNLACPIVALRRLLPYRLLHRLGLVHYPLGATLTARGLRRRLNMVGFEVDQMVTLMHVPRLIALHWCNRADRRADRCADRRAAVPSDASLPLIRWMLGWEILGKLPTRHLTGHFIAAVARRS